MIKQVERLLPESDEIYVVGTHDQSVDSRQFGAISRQAVIGKVVWRIKR
jgi:type IV secretory pathway protease TraF